MATPASPNPPDARRSHPVRIRHIRSAEEEAAVEATEQGGPRRSLPLRWTGTLVLVPLLVAPVAALVSYGQSDARTLLISFLGGVNIVTFAVYWLDKRSAIKGQWRFAESGLHGFALAGGWPAALAAQQLFRHKVAKPGFQLVFWIIVTVHQMAALDALTGWNWLARLFR